MKAKASAVVVGAGGDIGGAIALQLAKIGFAVVAADSDLIAVEATASQVHEMHGQVLAIRCDVTAPNDVRNLCDETLTAFRRIDVLVYAAGLLRRNPVAGVSLEEWQEVMSVNLTGAFLCAQAVYEPMRQHGSGRIVNIGSIAGHSTSLLGGPDYTASKAGLLGLTRHLAREWAPHGVTVNHISPGFIESQMTRKNVSSEEWEAITRRIPTGRVGLPSDVASVVSFLVSDEAAYVTGADVSVHGGLAL